MATTFVWMIGAAVAVGEEPVDFNRDVLPILAGRCYACHGPDEEARQAELRLDRVESDAIRPGNAAESSIIERVTSADLSERMPPAKAGKPLTNAEVVVLRQWIDEGARREPHWAYIPPLRPALPDSPLIAGEISTSIDRFVASRAAKQGWSLAALADRRTLIRRVTLDLTGLPPTPAELNAFVNDQSPAAYNRLVDRLLASPQYGEHMAVPWLDAARYADTHGYLFDTQRAMWRWRDWVIGAFNQGMSFDQFTVEQLAGDLIAAPTTSSRIATGFHRNHIINNEAGANPVEYLVENIVDRVNTTGTVWLGMTVGCAQCHDHKYDPLSQREYYQLYAFFNNIPEVGLDGLNTNAKPLISAPTASDRRELDSLRTQVAGAESQMDDLLPKIETGQREWESTAAVNYTAPQESLAAHWPLDGQPNDAKSTDDATMFAAADGVYAEGIFGESAALDGLGYLNAGDRFNWQVGDSFTFATWVRPDQLTGRMALFSRMQNSEKLFRGHTFQIVIGQPAFFLVNKFPDTILQVQTKAKLEVNRWQHVAVSYDGSGKAAGVKIYIDGKLQEKGLVVDKLEGEIDTEEPFWLGNGHPGAKLRGRLDDVHIFERVLTEDEIGNLPGLAIESLLTVPADQRKTPLNQRIRNYYLNEHALPEWRTPYRELIRLREELDQRQKALPTVMVMQEKQQTNSAKMLTRGAFDRPGDEVLPQTPQVLGKLPDSVSHNRLGLAQWLVKPEHPLTARVTVNRIWQQHFGRGLVATPGDFGVQGERPSHPQLLDHLASEFIDSGWDVKKLQRSIVTSTVYRQTSRVSRQRYDRDPENVWLTRGPRRRLSAEAIRDQALAAANLLVRKSGGESVRPYQPAGLWREVAFDFSGNLTAQLYQQDKGQNLYRRSMYTFWKRTSPPPTMLLFDAPDRERCRVNRESTSTPLQSLVLMNDPTYVEAARHLAARMIRQGGSNVDSQISLGIEILTCRLASEEELRLLSTLHDRQLARFSANTNAAKALLAVGETPVSDDIAPARLAAMQVVASVMLNLDETINIP